MKRYLFGRSAAARARALSAIAACAGLLLSGKGAVGSSARRAFGHVQPELVQRSRHVGRHAAADRIALGVSLGLRDPEGFRDLLRRLYDPADPLFHRFLTAQEFRDRYAPTDADVAAVSRDLAGRGLRVKEVSGNNMYLALEGSAGDVENAFALELHDYVAPDGRLVFAPSADPVLFGAAAEHVTAVHGLNTFFHLEHAALDPKPLAGEPRAVGNAALTPAKLQKAYGLDTIPSTGTGQRMALFELDGYTTADIGAYTAQFGLALPSLTNIFVDGYSGAAGENTSEVALDIEVATATSPGIAITVYESANTEPDAIAQYNRIASDNSAGVLSVSWGATEDQNSAGYMNSETVAFQQMVAQGQSVFVATGDHGAFNDFKNRPNATLVQDPASQPFITAVGGTTLTADFTTGAYVSEQAWGATAGGVIPSPTWGGGGGISTRWAIPTWQAGLANAGNKGSGTNRMIPDVSLDGDPNTGFDIYFTAPGKPAGWYVYGGTSAAAPIWAAFMARVNQERVSIGLSRMGFVNPALYQIAQSSAYASTFHDIADGSTNLFYPTVAGYDLATGLGTPKCPALYAILSSGTLPPTPPTNFALTSLLATLNLTWSGVSGATGYNVYSSATGNAGTFALLGSSVAAIYADAGAAAMTWYYVTATNVSGESGASPVLNGFKNEPAPGAPPGLAVNVTVSSP